MNEADAEAAGNRPENAAESAKNDDGEHQDDELLALNVLEETSIDAEELSRLRQLLERSK